MEELLPIVIGTVLGALIGKTTTGTTRIVLSAAAVLVAGAAATVLSGEYVESWMYLLLDFGEAALGLAFGYVIAHWLLSRRTTRAESRRQVPDRAYHPRSR